MIESMDTQPLPIPGHRYSDVSKLKFDGVTYTPSALAKLVAQKMLSAFSIPKGRIRILDPAGGDGALLHALLEELPPEVYPSTDVLTYDIDLLAANELQARIKEHFPKVSLIVRNEDFLNSVLQNREGGLFNDNALGCFDLIIANPPYVRTQVLGAKTAQALSASFGLSGRVDLFQPFLLSIAEVLAPNGIAGMIVSNRVMTTKGCSSLRRGLLSRFNVLHVYDLGDSKIFDAAVLPAVIIATTPGGESPMRMTTMYETREDASELGTDDPISALSFQDGTVVKITGSRSDRKFLIRDGILNNGGDPEGVWRVGTSQTDSWMETVATRTWGTFSSIGKIRVGIKTTADKVFIRNDWESLPGGVPELLRPLITRQSARRFKSCIPEHPVQVLYPHEIGDNGRKRTINLDLFPIAKHYLENHRSVLESRKYVIEAGRHWYEIWVPQNPAHWNIEKLVFPDISEKPVFWIDDSGAIINGDCYWLIPNSHIDPDLIWIALAVGNSTFIEEFYDHRFNNKLYAGRRRFITQYVNEFPLPDPQLAISKEIAKMARKIRSIVPSIEADTLALQLNELVRKAFGLVEEI